MTVLFISKSIKSRNPCSEVTINVILQWARKNIKRHQNKSLFSRRQKVQLQYCYKATCIKEHKVTFNLTTGIPFSQRTPDFTIISSRGHSQIFGTNQKISSANQLASKQMIFHFLKVMHGSRIKIQYLRIFKMMDSTLMGISIPSI